jgi:hypothetical protein
VCEVKGIAGGMAVEAFEVAEVEAVKTGKLS